LDCREAEENLKYVKSNKEQGLSLLREKPEAVDPADATKVLKQHPMLLKVSTSRFDVGEINGSIRANMDFVSKILHAGLVLAATFLFFGSVSLAYSQGALLDNPTQVLVRGNYAYLIADDSNAFEIIDITDPLFPEHAGSIHDVGDLVLSDPQAFDVSGDYAYVGNYLANSLEIIDISDKTNPTWIARLENIGRSLSIKVAGNYLYVALSNQTIAIIDISDPTSPTHVSSIFGGFLIAPLVIDISGDYLYYGFRCFCGSGGVRIVDISDPLHPEVQGSFEDGSEGEQVGPVSKVSVSGGFVYFSETEKVRIVDVSDPIAPTLAGTFSNGDDGAALATPYDIFVADDHAFVTSYGDNALQIIDISSPASPSHAGSFVFGDPNSAPFHVAVSGNYAYVTLRSIDTLAVLDVSDRANPQEVGRISDGEIGGPPAPTRNPVLIVPGVLGTEIWKGSQELWMDWARNVFSDDQFMDPLQFMVDLTPADHNLNLGDVLRKDTVSIVGLGVKVYDYTASLLEGFENQGYVLDTDLFLFPYDWRFGIAQNNIDALSQRIAGILAFTNAEKVDVIAHSTGGLLVKKYVMDNPLDHHISRAVFIGVPNTGAPKAIKALLVGDHFGNQFLSLLEMKKLAKNFPVVYDLSPSRQYYDRKGSYVSILENPLFGGDTTTDLTFDETRNFLLNDHNMNSQAITNAENLHSTSFDDYDLRTDGVDLYSVIGCKAGTIGKVIERRSDTVFGTITDYIIGYTPGDGTVPLESATNLPVDSNNKYYALEGSHATMMTQQGTRQQIVNIIAGSSLSAPGITQDISECELNGKAISVFSPVSLDIVDQDGNHSGLDDEGNIFNDIPSASFEVLEDHKFAYLPTDEGQNYTINLKGTGSGTFTLQTSDINNNGVSNTHTFSDVPVTTDLKGSLDPTNTILSIDSNGDGTVDQVTGPDKTLAELMSTLRGRIQSLNATDKVKQNLLKKIDNIVKKIDTKRAQNTKILANIKNKINKQGLKGNINSADVNSIIEILTFLETDEDINLDPQVLNMLKTKIQILNIKQNQKNDLLKRVEKLENKQKVVKALNSISASLIKKGDKGKLSDSDAQALLDILTQIETVI